jgi:hypothetical protein
VISSAPRHPVLLLVLWLAAPAARAQTDKPPQPGTTKQDEDVVKAGLVDPYTDADPKLMAAAGVVAYAPFPWADFKSTTDVDRVLGEKRVLWLETAHFKLASNLKSVALPENKDARRAIHEELKRLHKVLPKVPEKPKRLDPWLRLHLYALRAEDCYRDFQELMGLTDADFPGDGKEPRQGRFLGLPDKFLLLLFQKKSDLARYVDRFCGLQADKSQRGYHLKTYQMYAAIGVEGFEGFDDAALYSHVVYSLWHNFLDGYQGYYYGLPPWFSEGLAHWYSRKIETDFINVRPKEEEALDQEKQHLWPQKVRARAQYEATTVKAEVMLAWQQPSDLGYNDHVQSWSRVDYLMQFGPEKIAHFFKTLKNQPLPRDGSQITVAQLLPLQQKLLMELWELDAPTFDAQWKSWVTATYPKK